MSQLGEDLGQWPGDPVKVKYQPGEKPARERKVRAPKPPAEKVVLNPYKPRVALDFELMTDEEIIEAAGCDLLFDIESFTNLFMVAFKHPPSGKFIVLTDEFDGNQLEWILENFTCVGFNSIDYDMPLAWLACRTQDPVVLKAASDDLIKGMKRGAFVAKYRKHKLEIKKTRHIDLIEVCPLRGSLKLYGARLHAKRIQDVPWGNEQALEDWQIPITKYYCLNDLNTTELIYNNLTEQLNLRRIMTKEYGQDLMSKSDAQIAETVIGHEIKKIKGKYPARPKIKPAGTIYKFKAPKNLKFKTKYMQEVLRTVQAADFKLAATGYLDRPKEIEEIEIAIGNSIYRMGMGGLHSSESRTAILADDQHDVIDRDVASYYPAIVINCGLYPVNLGEEFLTVYKTLVKRRLEAKKAGDIAVSENLKIAVNGTFGKTGNPYSILYAPEVIIQILLGGQLYLLMLIEALELGGIPVMSANTDGFIMRCPKALRDKANAVVATWEKQTGFVTEETEYKAIYSRDVNAYLAVKHNGKVKGKNIFYDPWRVTSARDTFWQFQKNPNCMISVEAVERFVVDGTPLEQTIQACTDIRKFVAVKNVTGGAHKNGDYLGKVVRWYIAAGEEGTINYISNNHLVPDTQGAKPLMDLPDSLPDDIDYGYYVRRAEEMLRDMGFINEPTD